MNEKNREAEEKESKPRSMGSNPVPTPEAFVSKTMNAF